MKKAIRNLVLSVVMAAGIFAASVSAMAGSMQYVQTTMNFRSGASMTASVIGAVPAGAQVEVLGNENGWTLVRYNGTKGYIHGGNLGASYVPKKEPVLNNTPSYSEPVQQKSQGSYRTVYVADGYLALRTAPEYDDSNEIGELYTGEIVQLTGNASGNYVLVYAPSCGMTGWVNAGYLG